ncbi:efflux transporter outer membrane subunit [Magnetospirillum molischianum]|uniref:Solvent efflux pump outer membrane protein srpC n=1 Tax=Magnetospirillum molischianum DSM 120 TaxID=1150626 RepID=H8FQ33_MAGML|nr:efflux transporter outer membrane subunit [Magnetospirillum molischianum]CCG40471.1 Solvent efflux pump outer membrane protein srpC [Magnetospirillum molischianum DSM 120]
MKLPRLGSLFAVLLLAGCSLASEPVRPALPVSATWPMPDRGDPLARPIRWQSFFVAPALADLIAQALENNRDLRIAVQRVEVVRNQYRIQRAELFPHLDGGVDSSRAKTPADLSYTGKSVVANTFRASVSVGWELDLWGRIRSQDTAALERWLATDEARRAVALNLIAEIANTWLVGRELDERIVLAMQTIDSRRDSARIARRRYEVGASPRIDLTQAETLLGQADSALITLEQQREKTRNALTVLVGGPVGAEIVALSSVEDAVVRDLPPGLPSILLEDRPDIRGAENRLRAAEADIGAARAAFFPRIALTGDYGTASAALDGLFMGGSRIWTLAANLSMPLFEGGRLLGALGEAKAQRDSAVAEYERTVQTAFRDVADALAARRWLGQQVAAQQRTLNALIERARLSRLRYLHGASTYLDVLDAERDLFATEQALVETRRARLSSEVNLYAALGGGDDEIDRRSP